MAEVTVGVVAMLVVMVLGYLLGFVISLILGEKRTLLLAFLVDVVGLVVGDARLIVLACGYIGLDWLMRRCGGYVGRAAHG